MSKRIPCVLPAESRFVYLMISRTPTRFGSVLRRLGGIRYNHAAISLDPQLDRLYAFARRQHNACLVGGLVHESVSRYTLGGHEPVNVVIFRVPVTEQQFCWVEQTIERIGADHEYKYNLFSVVSYPLTGGFQTYKAYSCIEFVMYILSHLGYRLDRPLYRYKPDDLLTQFSFQTCYIGELTAYRPDDGDWGNYFDAMSLHLAKESVVTIGVLLVRLIFRRRYRTHMQTRNPTG